MSRQHDAAIRLKDRDNGNVYKANERKTTTNIESRNLCKDM